VVVFKSFFKAGLRFPLNEMIADVLKKFGIYLHQLTPNAIVRLSVYIWALRSQGQNRLPKASAGHMSFIIRQKLENMGCTRTSTATILLIAKMRSLQLSAIEILGNYSKTEDQLMTAAFGTRPKRRLKLVMDALNFEYPDYERLDRGVEGQKRKRVASVLVKEAAKLVKKDEETLKKRKLSPEPKIAASKKKKAAA
jgi:hypothetical protein